MARYFLRLKLRLLVNGITRGSGMQRILGIVGLVVGLVVGIAVAVGFLSARGSANVGDAALLFVGLFGLGWLVFPVLLFGSDNTVDPMRFSLLPLSASQLVRGQLAAGLVGGPTVFGVVTLGSAAYAVSDSLTTGLVAALAAFVTLLLCQVGSRALTTSIGGSLRSRRGRDFALVAAAMLAASFYPLQLSIQTYVTETGTEGLRRLAEVVGWIPFGWPFAAVQRVRDGEWATGLGLLVATVLLIAALAWIWSRAITRTLEGPEASASPSRAVSGELAPRWARPVLPRGAVGAVAAKELRYWWRDPRRRAAALTNFLVGIALVAVTVINRSGQLEPQLAFVGVLVAFFSALSCVNLFGLDGTAIWATLAAPGSAVADVRGRQLGVVVLVGPILLLLTLAGSLVGSAPAAWAAAAIGLCLGALGVGLGTTAVMAVAAPYPVPENPSNPFATGGTGGCSTAIYQFIGFFAQLALLGPVIGFLIWAFLADGDALLWAMLAVGPVWGAVVTGVGGRIAIGLLTRRGPEILVAVTPRG